MGGFIKLRLINMEPSPVLQHPRSAISWKELLCQQMGLSSSISQEAFEEAVYKHIGEDQFRMDALRWCETKLAAPQTHSPIRAVKH
ncbi:hypothetical protein ATANTOWER_025748 [Ataeniobius toweri]|uniref:Uncharacterized protein n=1 Tax=Ataeniobius toweri TaxID=208326 RepID=A0ABU7B151_9TELE|nr:hypothetical protein [Ataeniobius toweri]